MADARADPACTRRCFGCPGLRPRARRLPRIAAQRSPSPPAASSCPARGHRPRRPAPACCSTGSAATRRARSTPRSPTRTGRFRFRFRRRHGGALPAERAVRRHRVLLSAGPHQSRAARHGDAGRRRTIPPAPRRSASRRATSSCRAPAQDGTRSVLDLIVLRNDGRVARVAPDSSRPVLAPRAAAAAPATCRSARATSRPTPSCARATRSMVLAPIAPGQKQLTLEYAITPVRRRARVPGRSEAAPVNLLVEERNARVSGGTLALADSQVIEGRSFRR